MNGFDKLIAFFNPNAGLSRVRARYAMDQLEQVRSFEGAKLGRRTMGWKATGTSANSEILPALATLRNRSRDLVRNNVYGRRAVNILTRAMVGSGVMAKFENPEDKILFDAWCKQCDADGLTDFNGLQDLIERTRRESGECLVRFRVRRADDGLVVPLQLQVLEPDHLDILKSEALAGGGYVQGGIQFDAIGRRVGYWLYPEHPGEVSPGMARFHRQSVFVPASEIIHYFKRERPSQIRGVPELAIAMIKLRDIDDYQDAEIVRKKIEACFSVFVTQNDNVSALAGNANGERLIEKLQPGLITRLSPGEGVSFAAPSTNGGYSDFVKTTLRGVAAGLGLTYEQLSGDLEGVNYSSIRTGRSEFRQNIDAEQWNLLVPSLLNPIMMRWVTIANIYGKSVRPASDWAMPKPVPTDPLKEILAEKEAIKAGIKSLSQVIREYGGDPDLVFAELAKERDKLQKLGITVDIDAAVSEGLLKLAQDSQTTKATNTKREALWDQILETVR